MCSYMLASFIGKADAKPPALPPAAHLNCISVDLLDSFTPQTRPGPAQFPLSVPFLRPLPLLHS